MAYVTVSEAKSALFTGLDYLSEVFEQAYGLDINKRIPDRNDIFAYDRITKSFYYFIYRMTEYTKFELFIHYSTLLVADIVMGGDRYLYVHYGYSQSSNANVNRALGMLSLNIGKVWKAIDAHYGRILIHFPMEGFPTKVRRVRVLPYYAYPKVITVIDDFMPYVLASEEYVTKKDLGKYKPLYGFNTRLAPSPYKGIEPADTIYIAVPTTFGLFQFYRISTYERI